MEAEICEILRRLRFGIEFVALLRAVCPQNYFNAIMTIGLY